ncbi:MAG: lipopolysaccharide export LptBFGC system permease protein LptF [Arenicella sp.]|jgi:lipopolysaccharide export LptBFGC system permease protein LptF
MNVIKKIGFMNLIMLVICVLIVVLSEYLFLTGDKLHGIFIGIWAPTLLGVMIYLKLIKHERR